MAMRSTCSNCGRIYTLGDHLAGKTVRCKECGATFEVRAEPRRGEAGEEASEAGRGAGMNLQIQARPDSPKGLPVLREAEPSRRRGDHDDEMDVRRPRRGNRGLLIGVIVGSIGLVLLLGGSLAAVLVFVGGSGEPEESVDVRGPWPEPPPVRVAPDSYVILQAAGLGDEWTREAFEDNLQAVFAGNLLLSSASGDRKTFVLVPVLDVQAFVQKLAFCSVRSVVGRTITVVARKVEGPPPDADALTKALFRLKSANPSRRAESLRKLKEAPPDARRGEVAKALTSLLNDADKSVRREAAEALGAWADKDSLPTLLTALRDKETRPPALKALERLKDGWPEARRREVAKALEALLDDPDNSVRREGIAALGTWADKDSQPALLRALQDKETRAAAVKLLGRLKAGLSDAQRREVSEALLSILNDHNPRLRREAVEALETWADKESLPVLIQVLRDKKQPWDRDARAAAIKILGRLKEGFSPDQRAGVAHSLVCLLNEPNPWLRQEGMEALAPWVDKDTLPALLPALQDKRTRPDLLKLLGRVKDRLPAARRQEVAAALVPLLGDADASVRRESVEVLGALADQESLPLLLQALQDRETRTTAIKALGNFKDEWAAEAVAERLEDFFERGEAAAALKKMGPVAEKAVLARLFHKDWQVSTTVCDILETIGTRQSLPDLEKMAARNDIVMAPRAKKTIQAITARP
jgi:HEAT repeat protein